MKKFFRKYGKEILFVMIAIVCAGFFISVSALANDYSSSVDEQAIERAELYSMEQSALLEEQMIGIKAETEAFAARLALSENEAEAKRLIGNVRLVSGERYDKLKDVRYFKDGKQYDSANIEDSSYEEINKLADVSGTVISRAFQYDNLLMSVAVSAPVKSDYIDRIVFIYDRAILSVDSFKYADDSKTTLIPGMAAADFTLFCKYDGKILERQENVSGYDIGSETVQDGILRRVLKDTAAYEEAIRAMSSTDEVRETSVQTRLGTEKYVMTVTAFGNGNGDFVLLGFYALSSVYGPGYELVKNIWSTLLLCVLILVCVSILFLSDHMKVRRQIYKLAMVDAKLECPTPAKLEHDMGALLVRNKATAYAVIIARIHKFSYIAERFGEEYADALLKYAKNTYERSLLIDEAYAYSAGGEFALFLHYKDRKGLTERLRAISRRIESFDGLGDPEYKIVLSFNIYEVDRGVDESCRRMIQKALVVRNETGSGGTGSCVFYSDLMKEGYAQRAEVEARMEIALKNSEFHLFYQPKYNLREKRIDGSEILVRWFDTKINAYRKPAEFLPVFEENGFVNQLDRFVFFKACENVAERVAQRKTAYPVSVNVSRVTASQPDFLDYYIRIKKKFNIRDSFITLEFTESYAYENYEHLLEIIAKLHEAGFLCSLDDFGTGYSSYNILKVLDMDEIKLDKFFLDKGASPERDNMILESVIATVKRLGVKVTQEGVETKDDFDKLIALGCDTIQGYYFAKPMKYSDYLEFVDKNFGDLSVTE